jgi:hypothetical protein
MQKKRIRICMYKWDDITEMNLREGEYVDMDWLQ